MLSYLQLFIVLVMCIQIVLHRHLFKRTILHFRPVQNSYFIIRFVNCSHNKTLNFSYAFLTYQYESISISQNQPHEIFYLPSTEF